MVSSQPRKSKFLSHREKIEFTDHQGRPAAVATWDYLPTTIEAARAELRNFKMTGKEDGKIIHIERAVFNIQIGDHNNQNNFNTDLDKIKDPELRQIFADLMNSSKLPSE